MLGPVILDLKGLSVDSEERDLLVNPFIGGVILFKRNFQSVAQLQSLVAQIRQCRSELLVCVDQEGGRVQRFREGFTRLPPLQNFGRLFEISKDMALAAARKSAWIMAAELRAVDIDLSFAPVVDVDDNHSDVIGDRSFSNAVNSVVILGREYIAGMHDAGMFATLKHFPGHGNVKGDSHLCQPVDDRAFDEIEQTDMRAFSELLSLAGGVMPAHVQFPQVDSNCVGFSRFWLQEVLRAKLDFKGVIFSDDLSMEGASVAGDHIGRSEAALSAGCDAILLCNSPDKVPGVLNWLADRHWPISNALASLRPQIPAPAASLDKLHTSSQWLSAMASLKQLTSLT